MSRETAVEFIGEQPVLIVRSARDITATLVFQLEAIPAPIPGTTEKERLVEAIRQLRARLETAEEIAKAGPAEQKRGWMHRLLTGMPFDALTRLAALDATRGGAFIGSLALEPGCDPFFAVALDVTSYGPFGSPAPMPAAARDARWIQDIEHLRENLPAVAPRLFVKMPRETFQNALDDLVRRVPELTDEEIAVSLQMVLATARDVHTRIDLLAPGFEFHQIPLRFIVLRDGLFVLAATEDYSDLIGKQVLSFGTRAFRADFAVQEMFNVGSAENYYGNRAAAGSWLQVVEVLRASKVIPTGRALQLFVEDGGERLVVFESPKPAGPLALPNGFGSRPLQHWLREAGPYWMERLGEDTLYIRYAWMAESELLTHEQFVSQVEAELDASPARRVVIDLRHNPGGLLGLAQPLSDALARRKDAGASLKVVGLINGGTQSAALFFAHDIRLVLKATLVGEPAGQKLAASAVVNQIRLPNSGLAVSYPTRLISLGPPARDFEQDVSVPVDSKAFFAGRDPVLEEALKR